MGTVKWEMFHDPGHYDMWAVRPVGDRDFNSPRLFHLPSESEARLLMTLLDTAHCAVPQS
jgi:hypothetical protein